MAPSYNLNHVSKDYPFMTCLVKVNTYSNWQKTVTNVLNKCHGVYSFRMDDNGVVEISGTVDPSLLLKMLGRAGRTEELRWLQFGECSSNLFMPLNHSEHGGTSYSRDGRYLHAGNLPRPKLPSHDALRSSAHNQKHDYQIFYDQKQDYNKHAYGYSHLHHQSYDHKYDYQLGYDQNHGYQQGYYHDHGYPHSYDHRHEYQQYDHGHDYRYNSGYRHDGSQTQYHPSLPTRGGEDVGCCKVM